MTGRRGVLAALGSIAAVGQGPALAQAAAAASAASAPVLKALGGERYQVGRIVVDKKARSVTVPGRVQARDKPLEFLATSPGARKAYESLLELDASGTEFNLACILAGFERDPAVPLSRPLSTANAVGQRVDLWVAWGAAGQQRRISAAEALLGAEAVAQGKLIEWAYTGSFTSKDGSQLAADVTGTLVSFVKKDPTGVIEIAAAVDLGPYGGVRGNELLPPEGGAIALIVEAGKAPK